MVLIIVILLSLLCILQSSQGSSKNLMHSKYELSMSPTLKTWANHNVNMVYQILTKNKLS